MADASRPDRHERTNRRRAHEPSPEWRMWRTFGYGLALLIFALVVLSTSL